MQPRHKSDLDDERALAAEVADFARTFRSGHPWLWWTSLLGPVAVTAGLLLFIYLASGANCVQKLLAAAAATVFFFGKFVILAGQGRNPDQVATFFSPAQLALLVIYLDLAVAALLVPHTHLMFRLPWIGRRLLLVVAQGAQLLQHKPWLRRATFFGITGFVMFPLASTGSVGAAILGRLLGLGRLATIAAIAIGSVAGCGLMYFGAGLVQRYLDRDSRLVQIGGGVVLALFVLWLGYRYRRWSKSAS